MLTINQAIEEKSTALPHPQWINPLICLLTGKVP